MNSIYKVIWSKAKNCYVVASEIARSHTKSASGSEKIGGGTRRKLLASLMALSLLCGGLGVAEATVHVNEGTGVTSEVYTTGETYNRTEADTKYAKANDVTANTTEIAGLKTAVGDAGSGLTKAVADQQADIAVNKANITALQNELGNKADTTALNNKADKAITLTGYGITDAYTKDEVNNALNDKANKATVNVLVGRVGDLATALGNKADKADLDTANGEITALKNKTANLSDDGKVLKDMTTVSGTTVSGDNVKAGELTVTGEIKDGAGVTTTLAKINDSMTQTATNTGNIANLKTKTDGQQTAIDDLKKKTTKIDYDAANDTTSINGIKVGDQVDMGGKKLTNVGTINGIDIGDAQVDMKGKNLTGVGTINGTEIGMKVDGNYIHQDSSIWGNMNNVDTQVKTNAEAIAQEKTDREAADIDLSKRIGTVTDDGKYIKKSDTNSVSDNLKVLDTQAKTNADAIAQETADRKAAIGQLTVNGYYIEKDKNVSDNLVNLDNQAKANADAIVETDKRTGGIKRNLEGNQTTIEDKVTVNHSGDVAGVKGLSAETITTTGNASIGGDLKVAGTIITDKMVFGDKATNNYTEIDKGHITSKNDALAGDATKKSSSMELDHSKLEVGVADKDSNGHLTMTADKTSIKNSDLTEKNYSEIVADKDSVKTTVKDEKGNTTSTKSSATEIRNYAKDKDGNKTINVQTATQNKSWAKDKDGNESSIVQTGKDITNTAEKGTITSKAKDIVNDASGNISNNSQTMDTTVTGKATESYGSLDTTVNGNETHIVKGTKTETVDGMVTENYKAGQATNVTGDQTTNVSGTQTTTATDINRNASSGMIDTIDNDYGTNTETKVAGKTTTDVSIKGTGEKGQYIRGANESRDYLIKGTLKNSETKTVEKTSTEITDGNGKTSATIQDKTQISGSVTNGTSSAVSNVKADSIDTAVIEGTNTSLISQKKDSITSAVGNGTTSTVIQQGDKDITIASNGGTVGIVGKDIINNATNEITNTAGTKITDKVGNNTRVIDQTSITDTVGTASRKIEDGKITDTAGDSTVTTENGKGTTFAKAGSAAYSTEAGATKDTNIAGNHITTGRVDANELGVSDKDGTKTADLSVKAGEGVKASASDGTTTGSLDVTADEVGSTVKDASGKGSTFKQRIDAIMMESKNVSIKAEETLTNEAKVITNRASEVINNEAININNTATGIITSKASEIKNQADKLISNKVGENTWENMENGKITTSIKDGTKQNLTQSDATGTTQSTVDGAKSTVTIQNADGLTGAVTDGRNTSVQNQTASAIATDVKDGAGNENASVANATTSANTITNGTKANTVISTADGTSFINSEAAAPVGAGTVRNTTIKGNTITTGKVTMDYAEVMKDLGVHGNAKVDQNLEVGGTSTLTGDVTMESNAKVKKDLTVEGTTTTKTLKVTENATVDGTLDVTQKATFHDDVDIKKNLSVDGNATITGDVTARDVTARDVTAKSYKVGSNTYINADGINANNQKITNVADGSISEGSKDAVNGGQLYGVKRDLEHQVDKVGANAAAMANLRPMEFDPDSKWNIAAAIGNYGSETAAALGAFYRPNDDVMVNLSTAFGTGENMVGGGVSVRLGKGGNKLSREETNALKAQVDDLTARMDALLSVLNPNMSKDFPDVPENHWAYEAVSRLAGNDIVQGYPDGEFHGERTMTRYEMAEIIYNALSRGAEAEKELVEEFKPELQAMAASEKATAEKAEG